MDSETVESTGPPAPPSAADTASQPDADPPVTPERASLDAWVLVARMVEAGEWPEPLLMEQIVAAGDGATEPLRTVLHSRPRGSSAESSLDLAIGLLRMLGPPAVIPDLIEILKCYNNETAGAAADALVDFGTPGFDALVELCNDPSIQGYRRNFVFEAAVYAAGDDLDRMSRLGEVLRPILEDRIAKAREELRRKGWLVKLPPRDEFLDHEDEDDDEDEDEEFEEFGELDDDAIDQDLLGEDEDLGAESVHEDLLSSEDDSEEDDSEEDEEEIEPEIAEDLAYVVGALADLCDEAAYDSIMTAFREGLVDEAIVDQAEVDESYQGGDGEPPEAEPDSDWLSAYNEDYEAHVEELNQTPAPPRIYKPRPTYRYEESEPPPDIPVIAPIRNAGRKLGRNDPCWCGSGKKYKKCHLGKDTLVNPD